MTAILDHPAYVDAGTIAECYGVSRQAVLNWFKRGTIPGIRLGRRTIRFNPEAVALALEHRNDETAGGG